jgi:hypothetical protein
MKNFSDIIGNESRDLPACSAVPQPTAQPAACPTQVQCCSLFCQKKIKNYKCNVILVVCFPQITLFQSISVYTINFEKRLIFQYLIFPSAVTGWRCRGRRYSCCQRTHETASLTEVGGSECHHHAILGRFHSKRPRSAVGMCVGHAGVTAG